MYVDAKPLDKNKFVMERERLCPDVPDDKIASALLCGKCKHFGRLFDSDRKVWQQQRFRCWYDSADHCQVVEGVPSACEFWALD